MIVAYIGGSLLFVVVCVLVHRREQRRILAMRSASDREFARLLIKVLREAADEERK